MVSAQFKPSITHQFKETYFLDTFHAVHRGGVVLGDQVRLSEHKTDRPDKYRKNERHVLEAFAEPGQEQDGCY